MASSGVPQQLSLDVALKDEATFDNFFVAENKAAVSALQDVVRLGDEPMLYLWGTHSVGKTHLLQACCHHFENDDKTIMYLPLREHDFLSPEILQGMEALDLVVLDDIEAIAGNALWEEALFHFYNRVKAANARVVFSATAAPRHLPVQLPDLQSRLMQSLVFHIKPMDDETKIEALQMRAMNRGLDMPHDVANFLLKRYPRDMNVLFSILDALDKASMQAQRRLTLPFVRTVL